MGLLRRRGNGDVDGFLPIIAPDDFIRPTDYQYFGCTVDLYSIFDIYKGTTGRAIFEVYDNLNFSPPAIGGVTWVYGETINGVEQVSNAIQSGTDIFTAGSTNRWVIYYNTDTRGYLPLHPSIRWIYIGGTIQHIYPPDGNQINRGLTAIFTSSYTPLILQTNALNYDKSTGFTHILNGTFHVKGGLAFNTLSFRRLLGVTKVECDSTGFKDIGTGVIERNTVDNCLNMAGEIVIAPTVTSIGAGSFFNCPMITSVKMQGNAPTLGNSNTFNLQTPAPIPLYLPTGATGYDTGIWADTTKFTQIRY